MNSQGQATKTAKERLKEPPVLIERTHKVIARLEKKLGERLITYWNSPNGSICSNDVSGLYGILKNMGKVDRLSLFIKSEGGYGQASLRMVNLLRQFVRKLTVLIPWSANRRRPCWLWEQI